MTPEETKEYIEHRLQELGWAVQIGNAGYDRIFRFTDGTEAGTNQLCYKLLSLGSLQSGREITEDLVSMAIDDLTRMEEIVKRSTKVASRSNGGDQDADRLSIEQLAAVLESKVGPADAAESSAASFERPPAATKGKDKSRTLAKILIADDSPTIRAAVTTALSKDFHFVEASDGEQAWRTLLEQSDIELVVTDLMMPNVDGYDLIKRIRATTSPPHVVGIPIIVVTALEDTNAKLRALVAGANDFITKNTDALELHARVLARYKLSKATPRLPTAPPRAAAEKTLATAPPAQVRETIAEKPAAAAAPAPSSAPAARAAVHKDTRVPPVVGDRKMPGPRVAVSGRPLPVARETLLKRLYHFSSTTTITLSATVLVVVVITVILYVGRDSPQVDLKASQIAIAPQPLDMGPENETPPAPSSSLPDPNARREEARRTTPGALSTNTAPPKEPERTVRPPREEIAPPAASTAPSARAGQPVSPKEPRTSEPAVTVPPPTTARPAETPAPESSSATETASAAPVVAPRPKVTKEELASFLRRFAFVYEAGDIDQFVTLFAENARTNDRSTRQGIREDYEGLFKSTELRNINLGQVNWEVDGSQANGWGNFEVTVRRAGEPDAQTFTGSMTFYVEKVDGRLRIVRLYHGQRKAGS